MLEMEACGWDRVGELMSSFSERLCYVLIGMNGGQNQINAALFLFSEKFIFVWTGNPMI